MRGMSAAAIALWAATALAQPDEQTRFFETSVRPLLVARCHKCHGPRQQTAGLRLDSRDALLRGGDSGPAVVPGRPDDSPLLRAVRRAEGVEAMLMFGGDGHDVRVVTGATAGAGLAAPVASALWRSGATVHAAGTLP